jgi:hypothetical protein
MEISKNALTNESANLFIEFANKLVIGGATRTDYQQFLKWLKNTPDRVDRTINVFWFIAYLTGKTPVESQKKYFESTSEPVWERRAKN